MKKATRKQTVIRTHWMKLKNLFAWKRVSLEVLRICLPFLWNICSPGFQAGKTVLRTVWACFRIQPLLSKWNNWNKRIERNLLENSKRVSLDLLRAHWRGETQRVKMPARFLRREGSILAEAAFSKFMPSETWRRKRKSRKGKSKWWNWARNQSLNIRWPNTSKK